MHMGRQRHGNADRNKATGSGFAGGNGRAGKFAKTITKAIKVLGSPFIAKLLIATPLPAGGQANDKKAEDVLPPDKQTQVQVAARDGLPANTYVVAAPATDGEGKKAAPAGSGKSLGPEPNPSQMTFGDKFCETTVENSTVQVKIQIGNVIHYFDPPTSLFEQIGIPNASEKDISAKAYDKTNSKIYFVTKKGIVSLTLDIGEIESTEVGVKMKNQKFHAIAQPLIAGDLFTEKGNFYTSEDGSRIFIACPGGFLIVKPEYEKYFPWSSFGKKLPLENPTIDTEYYMGKELVRICDPTMKMNNGNYYKILFDMETFEIGQFEMPSEPARDTLEISLLRK